MDNHILSYLKVLAITPTKAILFHVGATDFI